MLGRLCSIAERVCASMAAHMRREEAELFPLLERRLCHAQQRSLLWRTLRAMPLRLLERVMPWIVGEWEGAVGLACLLSPCCHMAHPAVNCLTENWPGLPFPVPLQTTLHRSVALGSAPCSSPQAAPNHFPPSPPHSPS